MTSIYLATAYSPKSNSKWFKTLKAICKHAPMRWAMELYLYYRYRVITKVAGKVMMKGYIVFSPITHSHPIGMLTDKCPLDHEFWLAQDKYWVDTCDVLYVFNGFDWKGSFGVTREIEWATEAGKTVALIDKHGDIVEYINRGVSSLDELREEIYALHKAA